MPGLFIHMDVARRVLASLAADPGAAGVFAEPGPTPADLERIARANPAYAALGALGPDMFFLLPDFKPPMGSGLWGAANTVKDLYQWWDENFLGPWEDQLGPIGMNTADQLGALTGGLLDQIGAIAERASQFLIAYAEVLVVRQYDVFGLLGSGVPEGFDEQTFFWSDMCHYRRTYDFGRHLFTKARAAGDDRLTAFALGWLTHLATDTTGHGFTNEKCGGPYRLHWQRHKLVENHMDGKVYDSLRGAEPLYDMLSNAALHLYIAFNPDGTSRHDFFQAQPGPAYATGDATPDILDRKSKWDVHSELPADLADFLAEAFAEFFTDAGLGVATGTGAVASHPTIIEDIQPGSGGYADAGAISTTYWWLYQYLKWTTTDYYKLRRPDAPDVVVVPPFPSPPGSGSAAPGPGAADNAWADALEVLLAILAWIIYVGQVVTWGISTLVGIITSVTTYPVRLLIYEYVEIPLYNAWLALHWYLAQTGFTLPMDTELNPGLMTLGLAPGDCWATVEAALDDLSGGIVTPAATPTEPSGLGADRQLPREVVVDDRATVQARVGFPPADDCSAGSNDVPSEFLRPWLYPERNLDGQPVPVEPRELLLGPYGPLRDATALVTPMPGNAQARTDFEGARTELDTVEHQMNHLPNARTLGGPVEFSDYVVARLTRDDPGEVANFNLDADRGYGYLCWDWLRHRDGRSAPAAYRDPADPASSRHQYPTPVAPAFGWCPDDEVSGPSGAAHDPRKPRQVQIRYIDREEKFR